MPGASKEEKKAALEQIRVEKARATQEAREAKKNMTLCQKFFTRTTTVMFKLGKSLPPKFVKNLPKATKDKKDKIMAALISTQKALVNTMRSGGKTALDEKEVEKAVVDSEKLFAQLVAASQII